MARVVNDRDIQLARAIVMGRKSGDEFPINDDGRFSEAVSLIRSTGMASIKTVLVIEDREAILASLSDIKPGVSFDGNEKRVD